MTYAPIPLEGFLSNAHSPSIKELESFDTHKDNLLNALDKAEKNKESEEHLKIIFMDFLKDSFNYERNTKNLIDLSIYEDGIAKVLFEVKKPSNKADFVSSGGGGGTLPTLHNLECKAFHQSIRYFLCEHITRKNNNIKHIILTNTRDFYLIDAREYLIFAKDKAILRAFDNYKKQQGTDKSADKFDDTLKDYLPSLNSTLKFTHFHIQTTPLPLLYQALSPQVLLKQKNYIDANTLNQNFYDELLYILGLKEISQNSKVLIQANDIKNTLLDSITKAFQLSPQDDFETIFSLLTTWNNRLLFLRLLESMLLSFKHITKPFLDIDTLKSFTDLNTLFFEVLAIKESKRQSTLKELDSIPYLNSSLFDKTELEKQNKEISHLDSNNLAIFKHSILKKDKEYKDTQSLPLLEYLFAFLHAYDFTTTPKDIINHTKTNHDKLINAAVLGLVFEKLNGYKEGSFYTPSFITSYMCKESLEKVVIDKFNTAKSWECDSLESLAQKLDKLTDSKDGYKEANAIFDSIKICDPAVGSGHFLVSMLNAMIELKFRLKILCEIHIDNKGERDYKRLKDIRLRLENDEILIQDSNNTLHTYQTPAHQNIESHIIQKALFHNKRILIESCLFGVDINPNSCEITKLRLWIELLKYSFYIFDSNGKNTNTLETLPNIDINIKCGNSLVSRFDLRDSLNINNIEQEIQAYKNLVTDYKHNKDITAKQKIQESIKNLKEKFKISIKANKEQDKLRKGIEKHLKIFGTFALGEWINETTFIFKENMDSGIGVVSNILTNKDYAKSFEPTESSKKQEAFKSASKLIELRMQIDDKLSAKGYENAFEWRFEFPEVLSDGLTKEQIAYNNQLKQKGIGDKEFEKQKFHSNAGDFIGFDLVIGNPPYIRQEEIKHLKPQLQKAFRIYKGTSDIYTYFYEQGHKILKHNGILSFITSNKYCRAGYGEPLREFLLEATALLYYIELNGIKVFDSASVDTSILSFIKTTPDSTHTFDFAHPKDYDTKANAPLQEYITSQSLLQSSLTKESFIFQDSTNAALKAKIEAIGTPLKEWDISINYGIKTGYNEAFIIDSTKRDEILRNCVSENERQRTSELIKPILRGRDIKRYSYEWAGLWIINTHNGYTTSDSSLTQSLQELQQPTNLTQDTRIAKNTESKQVKIPPIDINDYPALKAHLDTHWDKIAKRADKGTTPYNLRNCAYLEEFEKEKIVYSEIVREPQFYLDNGEFKFGSFYAEATSFILSGNENFKHSLHYLLGILHSKLITYAFKEFYAGGGLGESGYRYKKAFLERLPIPKVDSKTEAEFIQIVQEILEKKKVDSTIDTPTLESKLDNLVYQLYNLSDDEVAIIENR